MKLEEINHRQTNYDYEYNLKCDRCQSKVVLNIKYDGESIFTIEDECAVIYCSKCFNELKEGIEKQQELFDNVLKKYRRFIYGI